MKSQTTFFIFLSLLLFLSCTNDSESDLTTPNTSITITYTNTVKSIIENNCNSCHGSPLLNGAPMMLITYQNVKDAITNRDLISRISLPQDAAGMMPYGGTRLPQATIDQIINWKNNGFAE